MTSGAQEGNFIELVPRLPSVQMNIFQLIDEIRRVSSGIPDSHPATQTGWIHRDDLNHLFNWDLPEGRRLPQTAGLSKGDARTAVRLITKLIYEIKYLRSVGEPLPKDIPEKILRVDICIVLEDLIANVKHYYPSLGT